MANYSNVTLSHNITEINENKDYYFNVSDDSLCGKMRSVPPGAPQDYYFIEIPSKEYKTVAIDWRFVNDTYVDNNSVNANHGDYSTVNVRGDDDLYGLIKFNLSSIPSSAIIESATLSLYLNSTSSNQDIKFYCVLQGWNESNVTWGNWYLSSNYNSSSPSIKGEIRSDSVDQYYNWSAITDVEYFHNNRDKNYGWLIKVTPSENLARFDSKEAVYALRRPVLYVIYS